MDFKIAGSHTGITGIQLDMKIDGISSAIIEATLRQSREARLEILKQMLTAIRSPRAEISVWAPRLLRTKIDPEKIGLLIGPGGKTIRAIQESSGAVIEVDDDGTVTVASHDAEGANAAMAKIEALTASIQIGRIYEGRVTSVKDFGAFIELVPGKDGLCHISELSDDYVASVADVCRIGDTMRVKVIAVDDQDRVKLSRRAVLRDAREAAEGATPKPS
jgi:polyribonucleotide nucleotidyltransferase